ncbi:MAG: single-stranded-DNA-specific exonuclease RecJ [Halioglobus sp.]|nr:single-stranded-DNA-specific exonuclease RecJ [Halioglobus sp.]
MEKLVRRRPAIAADDFPDSDIHPVLSRLYRARGVAHADELALDLKHLVPPVRMLGCLPGAELLADALAADQRILIVGDFDADGATSTALGISTLRACGARYVDYLVPNRFEYGYGLTPEIVELACRNRPDLLITVDNGIASIEGVLAAKEQGITTLVTDHHLAGKELPEADVIINPNQPGCDFPSKALAGVGVIFYLMLALRGVLRERGWFANRPEPNLAQCLDLVALGTVADVVPLDRNNRILVDQGLRRIRAGQARPGIRALLDVAQRAEHSVVASDLGFAVGPRINAAGRLDDMSIGIECLLSETTLEAMAYANELHRLNKDRRAIEDGMQREALQIIAGMDFGDSINAPAAMTLYQANWHQGVIGILASRVKERLHRPTIAFADGDEGQVKGSARSIPGIHIRDILDAVATRHPGLITRFGGHAMAAGLTLARADYPAFADAFLAEVERHTEDVELQAVIESDGELAPTDFDLDLATTLRYAGPWGQHFPEPTFDGRFRLESQRLVGEKHLKMTLCPVDGERSIDAIAFNIDPARWPDEQVREVDIAYRLDVNEFRGRRTVQLVVEQIRAAT